MCNYSTGCRSPTNIQMLAKMKLIMVEKWEGQYCTSHRTIVLHSTCVGREQTHGHGGYKELFEHPIHIHIHICIRMFTTAYALEDDPNCTYSS